MHPPWVLSSSLFRVSENLISMKQALPQCLTKSLPPYWGSPHLPLSKMGLSFPLYTSKAQIWKSRQNRALEIVRLYHDFLLSDQVRGWVGERGNCRTCWASVWKLKKINFDFLLPEEFHWVFIFFKSTANQCHPHPSLLPHQSLTFFVLHDLV